MNIAFVTQTLGRGGVERSIADLASHWTQQGDDVTVITYGAPSADDYRMDAAVRRVDLRVRERDGLARYSDAMRTLPALRRSLRALRVDVVVTMVPGANMLAVLAAAGTRARVVGQESVYFPAIRHRLRLRVLRRLLYRRLAALVVQSERTRDAARSLLPADRIHVIPSYVPPHDTQPTSPSEWTKFANGAPAVRLVAVGRLNRRKGFDVLLRALAGLARDDRWGLIILGEGEERSNLERLASELGIAGRVRFAGWVSDPRPTLLDSSIFVASSRVEGSPLVLFEAMDCGLPVVAADCPTGPRETITSGVDGILVPTEDPVALREAVGRLIDDPVLRSRLGEAALSVRERFSIDRVAAAWRAVLAAAADPARPLPTA